MTETVPVSPDGAPSGDGASAGPWMPATSVAAATWALFAGLLLVMVGNGLNGSVLGVRSEAEGFGLGVTGFIMAAYFAGFLAGTSYTVSALKTVGHIRVFAALASGASSVVLIQALSVEPVTWAVARFLFGACMAGIYVVVESWLNDLATNETRGRILSVYMIVTMGGIGVGQLMLNIDDPTGFRLFILVSVLVSMSLIPVTLSASSAPPLAVPAPLGLNELAGRVPTGVMIAFWNGAATGALMGMGAVYASSAGLSPSRISAFLFAPMAGALVAQWPIGWLSDHLPRRGVMLGLAVVAAASCLLALAVEDGSTVALLAMLFLGGTLFPMYSLGLAYTNDWLEPPEILGASATLVRVNGIGAIVGPLVTAGLMAAFGDRLFFWSIAGVYGVVIVYLVARIAVKDPLPMERQRRFVAFPARASAVAANLLLRRKTNGNGASSDQSVR